jgi:hypothetical protein
MTAWISGLRCLRPIAAACIVLACSGQSAKETTAAMPLRRMTAVELRAVPTDAALDMPVQAAVYAWRDFLPTTGDSTRARALAVSIQVRGGVVPPKVLVCDGIYLVSRDSVFRAPPAEQRAGDGPGAVECILRGGPAWAVGDTLSVIVSVSAGAQRTLIRRETTIDATS